MTLPSDLVLDLKPVVLVYLYIVMCFWGVFHTLMTCKLLSYSKSGTQLLERQRETEYTCILHYTTLIVVRIIRKVLEAWNQSIVMMI